MAHGTPASLDEMPEYLRLVRGGRPPSPELIAEMRQNYAAIGGRSPLTEISEAQGRALQALLGEKGIPALVVVGMRNWHPFIAEVVRELVDAQVTRVFGIPLAPQYSSLSVQKYMDAAQAALPSTARFSCLESFHDHPLLIQAFAERVGEAPPRADEDVVFTAHSLPVRVIENGDPYSTEVARTAAFVATASGVTRYQCAWQSAGRTPEPWLAPDLSDLIRDRSAAGTRAFLVVPVGFVCDHTEILFDIDVQAANAAKEVGVSFRRTASLNTSPTFIRALADLVERELARHGGSEDLPRQIRDR